MKFYKFSSTHGEAWFIFWCSDTCYVYLPSRWRQLDRGVHEVTGDYKHLRIEINVRKYLKHLAILKAIE